MTSKGRNVRVTFDAAGLHRLAWWAALLGYRVDDVHEAVTELLAAGTIAEDDVTTLDGRSWFADGAAASDPAGLGFRLHFQRVPEPKTADNSAHLDVPLAAGRLEDEVARLVGDGAALVGHESQLNHRCAVLLDPEDNKFCLR